MRITLEGFDRYINLFENISLPDELDKDMCISFIKYRSGDLYTYIQQPIKLKEQIEKWFLSYKENFRRVYNAMVVEYSPIENYDRIEEWTDNEEAKIKNKINEENSTENKTSAFNTSSYQPNDITSDKRNSNSENENKNNLYHSGRIHGNIGVTKNTDMIESELSLRINNVYLFIAELFEKHFLIQIY